MNRWLLPVAFAWLPGGAVAQEFISPEVFLDIAEGRTLTFVDLESGIVVGVEEYLNRRLSVWVQPDGRCVYGDITVEDRAVCFVYEDAPYDKQCWWPFRDGDRLLVRFARVLDSSVQEITEISDVSLSCPDRPGV